jgi:hypothetical protein
MDTFTQQIGQVACAAAAAVAHAVACDTMAELRSAGYISLAAVVLILAAGFVFRGRRI